MTSNGFLTDRIIDFCERRPKSMPLHLLLSVDGVGEKHNRIRGTANAWQSVMKTLHLLAPRQKELSSQLAVNQTIIDAESLTHYRELREILQPLGIRNQAVMAYVLSATYHTDSEMEAAPTQPGSFTPFGEFSRDQLEELFDSLTADLATYPVLSRLAKAYYLKGMSARMLGNKSFPNPRCVALNSHMRLYPDGRIPTCQFNSTTIGQIRSASFQQIWQSKQAVDRRRWVRNCPDCWSECEVLPNALYSGDIFRSVFSPSRQK